MPGSHAMQLIAADPGLPRSMADAPGHSGKRTADAPRNFLLLSVTHMLQRGGLAKQPESAALVYQLGVSKPLRGLRDLLGQLGPALGG